MAEAEQNASIKKCTSSIRKNWIEIIFILIFLFFLFKFGSILGDSRIVHDSPYHFVAGDMFWLTSEGLGIMNTDDINIRSPLIMKGDKDVYNNYPIMLPMAIAELSFFTGFEAYDTFHHLIMFFTFFMFVSLYLILRKINKFIALAGIPMVLLFFKWPFNYVLTWGGQMSDTNMFLVFFAIIIFMFLEIDYMFIFLGIVNAAGIFSHTRESLIFNLGILFFFGFQILTRKFNKKIFKRYVLSGIITTVLLINWLPVMRDLFGIYGAARSFFKYCPASLTSNHVVLLDNFGFLKWLIILGFLLSIILLFFSKLSQNQKFGVIMFITFVFTSNFCVLGNKTSQIRHFYPLTLAFFLGLFIWIIISKIPIPKNIRNVFIPLISIALMIFLLINFFPDPVPEYAVSNPFTHQAFNWVGDNLNETDRILYMYGDNHYQWSLFFLPMKIHDLVDQKEFIQKVQKNSLTSEFKVRKGSLGFYFKRTSFFNLECYGIDFFENNTICDYEYIYLNHVTRYPPVNKYVQELVNIAVNDLKFKEVYKNQLVTILKNPDVGGVCFETRQFS